MDADLLDDLIARSALGRTVTGPWNRRDGVSHDRFTAYSPGSSDRGKDFVHHQQTCVQARWPDGDVIYSPVGWGGICQFGQPGQQTSLRNKAYFPPVHPRFWIWLSLSQGIFQLLPQDA
jgi:hypothetical protein